MKTLVAGIAVVALTGCEMTEVAQVVDGFAAAPSYEVEATCDEFTLELTGWPEDTIVIYGIGADEAEKQGAQEKRGNGIHRKGLNGPVDDQRQGHGRHTLTGFDDFAKIDFDHDGIHHEEQANGDGNRHHRGAVGIQGQTVEEGSETRRKLAEPDTGRNTEDDPKGQILFKKAQITGRCGRGWSRCHRITPLPWLEGAVAGPGG